MTQGPVVQLRLAEDEPMIWRSVWRIESTGLLTELALWVGAVIFGGLGLKFLPPVAMIPIGVFVFLLIYRLRYKRL